MDTSLTMVVRSIASLAETLDGRPFVATVGSFDGVHRGHRSVIDATIAEAGRAEAASVLITFSGHPSDVIRKHRPPLITTTTEKLRYLSAIDADAILLLPFTRELARTTMKDFIRPMQQIGLVGMVLGYDSRFGSDAFVDPLPLFDEKMADLGVSVQRVRPLRIDGTEVSSSRIRTLLSEGRISDAERLLGHPYSVIGRVTGGRQIGRTMGFPTANILPEEGSPLIPRDAVFAAEVLLAGQNHPAMAYYGTAPTIDPNDRDYRIEATLLDFSGDIYGDEVEIAFRQQLRGDQRFDSLEQLREQLRRDEKATRQFFRTHPPLLLG